ncbi:hypothetical protein DFH08DRAFT_801108 [Mycena albidolilacea]|uniref:Uncharacterized protein n=1 Tax=Mycena albidolilacea TaxID=1033008 RepID=A0AAD7AHQ4_9AGAR|nr:hypothetical protein DFH08DRAFT_801108 [Mycena albidolilacea]
MIGRNKNSFWGAKQHRKSSIYGHTTEQKASIEDQLKRKKHVNDKDSAWLNGPTNLIDEQQVLDLLENTSDYEQGLSRLDESFQAAVQCMKPKIADWVKNKSWYHQQHAESMSKKKWTEFVVLCGVLEEDWLALSKEWLGHLNVWLELHGFKQHGEAALASPEIVEEERKRVQELIEKGGFKPLTQGIIWCFKALYHL